MRVLGVALGLALVLGLAAAAQAAPLDLKQVPADAKWVGHVDVDAMRASTVVQRAWNKRMQTHPEAKKRLDKLPEILGMDIRKDLHGVTFYGTQIGKHTGVLIVKAELNQKLLLEKIEKAANHKVVKFESYDLHSWTHKGPLGERTVWGVFYKPDCLVLAKAAEPLQGALNVLDGKAPSVSPGTPLAGKIAEGTTFLMRATGLAEANLPTRCAVARQIESIRFAMGEYHGESFDRARITMKTPEAAEQIKAVIEGGKALFALHAADDAELQKLVDAMHVGVRNKTVWVRWSGSADAVWAAMERHSKELQELRNRIRERIMARLTPEQREKLKKAHEAEKEHQPEAK